MRNGDMSHGVSPFFMRHIAAFAPRYRRTRVAVRISTGAGTGKRGRGYGRIIATFQYIILRNKPKNLTLWRPIKKGATMATIDANIHLADYYFSMLDSLSRKAKLYLVKRLTDSLLGTTEATVTDTEAEKDKSFHNLAGIWTDDPEAE